MVNSAKGFKLAVTDKLKLLTCRSHSPAKSDVTGGQNDKLYIDNSSCQSQAANRLHINSTELPLSNGFPTQGGSSRLQHNQVNV